MSLEISIPTTSESAPPSPHTLYHILLRLPIRSYTLPKRYSDFLSLHTSLTTHTSIEPPVRPPPKHYITSTVGNPRRTDERRRALESYLLTIATCTDTRWRSSPAWRAFLSLPASYKPVGVSPGGGETQAVKGGKYAGLPNAPVTDPTAWLDTHRELKALLHDARLQLASGGGYDDGGVVADSRRSLTRAGALISALDGGLREVSKLSGAQQKLLDGELRRRRDLISAARKEREGLETLARQQRAAATNAVPALITPTHSASPAKEKALFGGRAGGGVGGGGKRILGARIEETAKTRELDNSGVLALQQQVMDEQDQGVERLLQVVRRQKELGVAINRELEEQVEMLKMLEDDADRVDMKTRAATRKAQGIS